MSKPLIIACIPAFNEEKTIAKVILQTQKYVDRVIVCDDGSTDMTAEIAERLGASVVRHPRNLGYGASLNTLFKEAIKLNPSCIVTMDADGQHDPSHIPKLVEPIIMDEADIVIGSRFLSSRDNTPKHRRIGVKLITSIARKASYQQITDAQSGFRAYSRRAIEVLELTEPGMGVSTEILIKASREKLRIIEKPITINYNVEKPSKKNPILHALDVITSTLKQYSIIHPLTFYGLPGSIMILIGVFFGIWALEIYRAEGRLVVNLALLTIGSILIGLLLILTGIMLFVLISVVRELKAKP
ncbi:MAG: glycosyltransferase family 2 protein [Candidatus Methanomethylicia archaeon]